MNLLGTQEQPPLGGAQRHGQRVGEKSQQQHPAIGGQRLLPERGRVFQAAVKKVEESESDGDFEEIEEVLSGRSQGGVPIRLSFPAFQRG